MHEWQAEGGSFFETGTGWAFSGGDLLCTIAGTYIVFTYITHDSSSIILVEDEDSTLVSYTDVHAVLATFKTVEFARVVANVGDRYEVKTNGTTTIGYGYWYFTCDNL